MRDRRMWILAAIAVMATAATACSDPVPMVYPTRSDPTAGPPSASASPTPIDPTGRTGCAAVPSACGYPDATNTGVPAGTVLRVHQGDLQIDTPGAVVENLDIRGCVRVTAPNVTIRRSRVTCTFAYAIASFPEEQSGGLLIEDVEVDCDGSHATAIGYSGFVARRVYLHGCENGLDVDDDVTIEDSYIDEPTNADDAHADGIQLAGGSDIVIRHNTIFMPEGTSAVISHPTDNVNVIIEGNLFGGGAYTLYCPSGTSTNFRVINNRFTARFGPNGGAYGPWDGCGSVADNRGNVWDETLAPLQL